MKRRLALLALAAVSFPLAAPAPAAQEEPATLAGEIEDAVDASLRWLRGRQEPGTGSYGGVEETALAVLAFTGSHRAYTYADGPFVGRAVDFLVRVQAEDGAIADEGADAAAREASTRLAARALAAARAPSAEAALVRARAFLGGAPADEAHAPPADPADEARELLARRGEDGSFGGSVAETARGVIALARLAEALAAPAVGAAEAAPAPAVKPLPPLADADRDSARRAMERGARFLVAAAGADGLWGFDGRSDPGITAMVAGALLAVREPRPAEVDEAIERALDRLVSLQHEDGSIHAGQLANYVTSAAVLALAEAGREEDRPAVERATRFLRTLQADEGEGYAPGDRFYGGVGYGGDERPDLSNLNLALDALAAGGVPPGDETFRKALVFLQRCQNRSESNDLEITLDGTTIRPGDDGGAGYAPGDSKAGFVTLPDGTKVPRSYGSMTYALLKGYMLAGLPKDDPRVEAAWEWLRANWTLDVNPGFDAAVDPRAAYQGLFYYFTTMARTLDVYGEEVVRDAAGTEHPWREELIARLVAMQRPDGSWRNENAERWYEGNPVLATSYALLALDAALGEASAAAPSEDAPGGADEGGPSGG